MSLWTKSIAPLGLSLFCALTSNVSHAAGTLYDADSGAYAEIVDHQVRVVINNGFARTEVVQTFRNPTEAALDAVYEFPIPKDAALAEMTIVAGDRVMNGEVVAREEAETIYEERASAGEQAGLATLDGHQNFRFSVSQIPGGGEATMSFVYYERLAIDDSVGRYLYPLEDGGTATSFWTGNDAVSGSFSFELELKSAQEIEEVRMPSLSPDVEEPSPGHYRVSYQTEADSLSEDIVFYYRIAEGDGGRLEVIPYRSSSGGSGTFMLVLTPGVALKPITTGTDYVFVLDISGSMAGKLSTLTEAAAQSVDDLDGADRFRVVAFDENLYEVSAWQDATAENVLAAQTSIRQLGIGGSTDLYSALNDALGSLDPERVTSVVLITDAETNTGVVDPSSFEALVRESDVRVYGMLLGNNANWPLMEIVATASGGYYAPVSNRDDILGQVMLARNKATHEALHDTSLTVRGCGVEQTTDFDLRKIYRGQQLVVFGRYSEPGTAEMELGFRQSGEPVTRRASFELPDEDARNPELERLWALEMIHAIDKQRLLGLITDGEARESAMAIAVEYQLVTDHTAMIVLEDASFDELGIERTNEARVAVEREAQATRATTEATDYGVDSYSHGSSSDDDEYGDAAALDPALLFFGGLLGLGAARIAPSRRRRRSTPGAALLFFGQASRRAAKGQSKPS